MPTYAQIKYYPPVNKAVVLPETIWGATWGELLQASNTRPSEIHGGGGYDSIIGANSFNDKLFGDADGDTLMGLGGNDELHGGDGNDTLGYPGGLFVPLPNILEEGNDWLFGDGGNDELHGGRGTDWLWGGTGADKFHFHVATDGLTMYAADKIWDFNPLEGDHIVVHGLNASNYVLGMLWGAHHDMADAYRGFVYEQGTLYFDQGSTGFAIAQVDVGVGWGGYFNWLEVW